jgi:hypothetical protein
MSMKNSSDTIGNWTCDVPVCSVVPQPTAPPRAHLNCQYTLFTVIWQTHGNLNAGMRHTVSWKIRRMLNRSDCSAHSRARDTVSTRASYHGIWSRWVMTVWLKIALSCGWPKQYIAERTGRLQLFNSPCARRIERLFYDCFSVPTTELRECEDFCPLDYSIRHRTNFTVSIVCKILRLRISY